MGEFHMINGYKVYVAFIATNLIKNNYWPTSKYSMKSFAGTNYVDSIFLCNGQSEDDTVPIHLGADIEKLEIIETCKWDTKKLNNEQYNLQISDIVGKINDRKEKCILFITSAELLMVSGIREDFRNAVEELIESENCNFFTTIQAKFVTKDFLRNPSYHDWYAWSPYGLHEMMVVKYDDDNRWFSTSTGPGNLGLTEIHGTSEPINLDYSWNHCFLDYERWFQTIENFNNHRTNHAGWDGAAEVDDAIVKMLKKDFGIGISYVAEGSHPIEAREMLSNLKPEHYGYHMWGYLGIKNSPTGVSIGTKSKKVFDLLETQEEAFKQQAAAQGQMQAQTEEE
jgi:hypothetical protein